MAVPAPSEDAVMAAPAPSVPAPPVPVPPIPSVPYDPVATAASYAASVTPVPAPTADAIDFKGLMTFITPHLTAGRIAQDDLANIAKGLGLKHVGELSHRPDLIALYHKRAADVVVANGGAV
jgi:hypothetical protein